MTQSVLHKISVLFAKTIVDWVTLNKYHSRLWIEVANITCLCLWVLMFKTFANTSMRCMCNIYEEREFGNVYINGLHCWLCVHFELEHPVFHEYNRGSPRNSILFVADDHSSSWLVERQERAGTRSVVFVKRMTLVMLKNMLGGSLVNEFVSPVSGSECGPENRPPFGHPLWVPKRRLIIWAVFWTTVRWPFWNRCGYQNLMSASTQLDVHLRSAVLVCSWRASPTSEIHSGWINWKREVIVFGGAHVVILTSLFLVLLMLLSLGMAFVEHHCRNWVTVNRKILVEWSAIL
jgi:hypothetical protein